MKFYVYVIYSLLLDRFYVGYTSDLQKRLSEHNTGISVYTSKTTDWTLKYTETFSTRQLAMKREREIKQKKSRKYIEQLINGFS